MSRTGVAVAALLAVLGAGAAQAQMACEALKGMQLPDVKVTEAVSAAAPAPHCKLSGVIGKETNFAVWLPDSWNGKFVMGGQGGFAGTVENQAMTMQALQKGYATAGTDTGHKAPGADGSWALGDMERIVNYAHAAIHRVTEVSKYAVKARYGQAPEKSYFAGCSNGGRQALMSAQRYPDDFDAIVAGAPALNFTGIAATFTNVTAKMYPDPANLATPVLGKGDQATIAKAVLASCDKADGLEDGVLTDPRTCSFDPRTIACKGANSDTCLTKAELDAVDAIRSGPKAGGKAYHVGFPYGGEANPAGWQTWLVGAKDAIAKGSPSLAYGFGVGFMRYFVMQDPNWDYRKLDLPNLATQTAFMQKTLSPNDPDLSAFRKSGGKLMMYHGWSDSALSPLMSIGYLDEVYAKDAAAKDDVRLFMLPGVLHCAGGPGPDRIDYLDALDKWASGGPAPDELRANFAAGGGRKVCAYPKLPVFKGTGDGKSADQFECR
ncbi:MAG: tannase/feruloyl esterase family alpha/beta hydrolase [Alphaproteobacteria bacterium]|nr:tannase/feruloyl esterase family alpha/beta hydrolase [Alphaproteobacteria bacterium]